MKNIKEIIKANAQKIGFGLAGVTTVEPLGEDGQHLKKWLESGFHADMQYMERNLEKRINPAVYLDSAGSVIVLGANYFNRTLSDSQVVKGIAMYARGRDYHDVIRKMMKKLIEKVKNDTGRDFKAKLFVDSSPVLERALARRAGLGWFGKNSCLINKKLGSYFFISGIIIDIELEPDLPYNENLCGRCTKCIDACPTGAIVSPYVIDSRLCISYHTIENKKEISEFVQKRMNGWLFGCDICQQVCPWNRRAKETEIVYFKPSRKVEELSVNDLLNLSRDKFNSIFRNSPLKRVGYEGFMRNVMIAEKHQQYNFS